MILSPRLRATACAVAAAVAMVSVLVAHADTPSYAWSAVAVQSPPPTMHPGEIVTLTVVLRNDGSESWSSDGLSASPVRLGATLPRDRSSAFALQDPTWLWSNGRRIRMETPAVPPGGLASFTFTFRAPELAVYPQTFTERFAPLVEGGAWMDDHQVALATTVVKASGALPAIPSPPPVPTPPPTPSPSVPAVETPTPSPSVPPLPSYPPGYSWKLVFAQPAPATMHPGEKIALTVALQNTGAQTWLAEEFSTTPMRLAAVNAPGVTPRERASTFGRDDPTWIWSSGRRIRMTSPEAPGGTLAFFTFTFTAPALPAYPQTFTERFAPVVEGVSLLDNDVIAFTTQVRPVAGAITPIPEAPGVPTPPASIIPTPIASPSLTPLPTFTPSISPLPTVTPPVVSPSPVQTPTPPPPPGSRCPTTASPASDDLLPPAVALGFAPNGALLAGKVSAPAAVAYGFAKILAADAGADRAAKTDLAGFTTEYFGGTGSGPSQMRWPSGIAVSDSGTIFVADTGNDRIQLWSGSIGAPAYLTSFGSTGSALGQFRAPHGIAVIPNGPLAGNLAIADTGNDRIQIVDRLGHPLLALGAPGTGPGELSSPTSVGVWQNEVFVADTGNERIERILLDGTFAGAWGGGGTDGGCTPLPTGLLVNAYGVFVAESGAGRVEHFTRWGALVETLGGSSSPSAVAMDANAKLYIAEPGASRVARWAPAASAAPPTP